MRNLLTNFVSNSRFLEIKTKKQQDLLYEEYLFWSWDQKITAGQKMPKFIVGVLFEIARDLCILSKILSDQLTISASNEGHLPLGK